MTSKELLASMQPRSFLGVLTQDPFWVYPGCWWVLKNIGEPVIFFFLSFASIIHLVSNVRIQEIQRRRKESLYWTTANTEAEVLGVRGHGITPSISTAAYYPTGLNQERWATQLGDVSKKVGNEFSRVWVFLWQMLEPPLFLIRSSLQELPDWFGLSSGQFDSTDVLHGEKIKDKENKHAVQHLVRSNTSIFKTNVSCQC